MFGVYFSSSINCVSSFVVAIMVAEEDGVSEVRVVISFPISFDENLVASYSVTLVSFERWCVSGLISKISVIYRFDYFRC